MAYVVGIDLGTTNSIIALSHRGKPESILIDGSPLLPSVVCYRSDGGITTGRQAKARLLIDPDATISACKRFMGDPVKRYRVPGDLLVSPIEVSSEILKYLVTSAARTLGEPIEGAIITVPAYFTEAQKQDTKSAAELAGIRVLGLLPEPTSAALAYGITGDRDQTLLVYDLGGGTFDVSILEVKGRSFTVKAVGGDTKLGGEDFDQAIIDRANSQFVADTGAAVNDVPPLSRQRLKEAAESAKMKLAEAPTAQILVQDYVPGYNLDLELTLAEYNILITPLIARTLEIVRETLSEAKLTVDDIDRVILVGGSTKNRAVRDAVAEHLKAPWISPQVDEMVAYGAATVAEDLKLPVPKLQIRDVTAHSLGIDALGDNNEVEFLPIISRQTHFPCRRGHLGSTSRPMQNVVVMSVFRGENPQPEHNAYLGELQMDISRKRNELLPIGVIFELDRDGILHFTAVEFPLADEIPEVVAYALSNSHALDLETVDKLIACGVARKTTTRIQLS